MKMACPFRLDYAKRMIYEEMQKNRAIAIKSAKTAWTRPCDNCGKCFGGNYSLIYSHYCSEKCELESRKKINPLEKFEIKTFWKLNGKDIWIYDEVIQNENH